MESVDLNDYDQIVLEHYRLQADQEGLGASSTMADHIVRQREVEAILHCTAALCPPEGSLLEVGCGNGYALALLRERFPGVSLTGVDYSPEMVALAESREIPDCAVARGDVRALEPEAEAFDLVVSERCVINLLDEDHQSQALRELHRVLRPGGWCVFIEAFREGLDNLNEARAELELEPISVPHHNLWFTEERFREAIDGLFEVRQPADAGDASLPPQNFLSSHYFMSRVVHAALARNNVRNTKFVEFFSFMPPYGNFASIQLRLLQKI